jgi:hypothetical protein
VTTVLEKNLSRLRRTDPELARRLEDVSPAPLCAVASRCGPLTATIETNGRQLNLASRYDPIGEARQLIGAYDPQKHACVVVLGLGMGYHVAELTRPVAAGGGDTVIIVFEPSLPLLRSVLEVIDHHEWLGQPNVILADDTMDRASLLGRIDRFGAIVTQGTVLITHPPSRQIHGKILADFGAVVSEVMSYCRTNVATTLVNSARTCRNLANNVSHYAAGASTDELLQATVGVPAVCVGAGPSLARNVDLLSDPQIRANVVLISAQTTLKPLLDRGLEPDIVTALDYHEISRRFYEDIGDLPRVTLVAEPLANETILDNFPGPIRLTNSGFLDRLLGDEARPRKSVPAGATVAHLSFYVAQHLGCDPIILIGQDLGFTDGLYYCPGTAIHDVWAPELGAFNTLEMMEWQRIVRHRQHLHKLTDIHGEPIYSDEQMQTYLKQFERDFARMPQTVIDATEGGLPKQHTQRMTFAEALATYAKQPVPPIPLPARQLDPARLASAERQLRQRTEQVAQLIRQARKATRCLSQMLEHQRDKVRVDRLFKKLDAAKRKVQQMQTTFELVNQVNAIGAFKRARADRAIEHGDGDPFGRQRLQIERDIENMDFLISACAEAQDIFRGALRRVVDQKKRSPQTSDRNRRMRLEPGSARAAG